MRLRPLSVVVVNPAPPATAVPIVKAEKQSSKKYVKLKDMRVALTESQQKGGELRDLYTDCPGSRSFIVRAFRESGYTALSVDIAKKYLHSKSYTVEDASAAAMVTMIDLPLAGIDVGMTYRDARKENSALLLPALASLVAHWLPAAGPNGQIARNDLEGSDVFQAILKAYRNARDGRAVQDVTRHMFAYSTSTTLVQLLILLA